MEEKIIEIIASVLDIDQQELTKESLMEDFKEWDSLAQLSVIAELEEQLKIKIPFEKVLEMQGVGDIVDYIKGVEGGGDEA